MRWKRHVAAVMIANGSDIQCFYAVFHGFTISDIQCFYAVFDGFTIKSNSIYETIIWCGLARWQSHRTARSRRGPRRWRLYRRLLWGRVSQMNVILGASRQLPHELRNSEHSLGIHTLETLYFWNLSHLAAQNFPPKMNWEKCDTFEAQWQYKQCHQILEMVKLLWKHFCQLFVFFTQIASSKSEQSDKCLTLSSFLQDLMHSEILESVEELGIWYVCHYNSIPGSNLWFTPTCIDSVIVAAILYGLKWTDATAYSHWSL